MFQMCNNLRITPPQRHRRGHINPLKRRKMQTRKKLLIALVAAVSLNAAAIAAEDNKGTAFLLADACRQMLERPDRADALAYTCVFKIEGFIQGYRQGTSRGALVALTHSAGAQDILKGIADLRGRLDIIRPDARCLPENAGVTEVLPVFMDYYAANLKRMQEPYGSVLRDAVEQHFCRR